MAMLYSCLEQVLQGKGVLLDQAIQIIFSQVILWIVQGGFLLIITAHRRYLPLTMSAIMAANFDSTRSTTDTVTFGYSPAYPNRAWPCHMGCIIAFNRALTAEERLELNAWAQKRTAYAEAPSKSRWMAMWLLCFIRSPMGILVRQRIVIYQHHEQSALLRASTNLVTADETAIEYLDGTTGSREIRITCCW